MKVDLSLPASVFLFITTSSLLSYVVLILTLVNTIYQIQKGIQKEGGFWNYVERIFTFKQDDKKN